MVRMGVKQTRQLRALIRKLEAAHSLASYASRDHAIGICIQDLHLFLRQHGAETLKDRLTEGLATKIDEFNDHIQQKD